MGMLVFSTRKWAAFRDLGRDHVFFLSMHLNPALNPVQGSQGDDDEGNERWKEELEPRDYNVGY